MHFENIHSGSVDSRDKNIGTLKYYKFMFSDTVSIFMNCLHAQICGSGSFNVVFKPLTAR